jgi:hypothetical protein
VVRLLQDGEMRKEFGENGMRKVNIECAPEVVGRKTRMVYSQALSGKAPMRQFLVEKQSSSQSSS